MFKMQCNVTWQHAAPYLEMSWDHKDPADDNQIKQENTNIYSLKHDSDEDW